MDVNPMTGRCRDCGRLAATCRVTSCRHVPMDGSGARESFAALEKPTPAREPDTAPLRPDDECDVCGAYLDGCCAPLDEVAA